MGGGGGGLLVFGTCGFCCADGSLQAQFVVLREARYPEAIRRKGGQAEAGVSSSLFVRIIIINSGH